MAAMVVGVALLLFSDLGLAIPKYGQWSSLQLHFQLKLHLYISQYDVFLLFVIVYRACDELITSEMSK